MPALGRDESREDFARYAKVLADAAKAPRKTSAQWIADFLDYIGKIKGLSPKTIGTYSRMLGPFAAYLKESGIPSFKKVKRANILGFLADRSMKGLGANSLNLASAALRSFFRHLRRFGFIKIDPTKDVENIRVSRPLPGFLTDEEAAKLCEFITVEHPLVQEHREFYPLRDRAIVEFIYSTGCRVSEAAGIKMRDLDLEGGKAKVLGKGNKERMVFIAGAAGQALREYLVARERLLKTPMKPATGVRWKRGHYKDVIRQRSRTAYLFINREGQGITPRGIELLMQKYSKAAGVRPISPHALRHSFATGLVNAGLDIRYVQELMGHANVGTTGIYVHTDIKRLAEVYHRAHPHGHGEAPPGVDLLARDTSTPAPLSGLKALMAWRNGTPAPALPAPLPAATSLGTDTASPRPMKCIIAPSANSG
jgi:integrase/recombinase XerC